MLSSEQLASLASLEQKAVELARRGDFGIEARAVNQELTQLAPDNSGAWTRFARCCLELGELEAANAALESALTLNPQNNIARSLLQEVVRRELLANMPPEPPARARKSRSKKAAAEE
ncbi:MAG: tetratricopeptide repeat protein [Vicinamibacterales bacterium]